MFDILTDIRYSARKFLRAPSLSAALLLTIALGIGSNVTVHRFVVGLTRATSPLASAGRVVSIFSETGPVTYDEYASIQGRKDFEWIGAAEISPESVTLAGQSTMLSVAAVTPELADALGLSLKEGAAISRARSEDSGKHLRIDGADVRVGNVAPEWLEGLYRDHAVDLWIPLRADQIDRGRRNIWVVGRLRPKISSLAIPNMRVIPYSGMMPAMAEGLGRIGRLLNLAAGLVFFIACANVASFLLGRASARSHETSLRVALGAGRRQLLQALLSDSIVISIAGGAFGLLLAVWTSHVLPALLFESDAEQLVAAPDLFGIAAACAVCAGITIVSGLLPVFAISHDRPADVLRRESAGPSSALRRVRTILVMTQMASCCLLVIATAFLIQGLHAALRTSVGQRLGQPILASMMTADPYGGTRYFEQIQDVTRYVPGVTPMAWMEQLPGGLPAMRSFRVEPEQSPERDLTMDTRVFTAKSVPHQALSPTAGRFFGVQDQTCRAAVANESAAKALFGADTAGRSIREPGGLVVAILGVLAMPGPPTIYYYDSDSNRTGPERFHAATASKLARVDLDVNVVSANYFAEMGVALVAGRIFSDDPVSRGCREGVINEQAADLYFNGNAVGATVIDDRGRRARIVGIVHSSPLGTFEPPPQPAVYFPMRPDSPRYMTLILAARDANPLLLATLTRTIDSVAGRGPAPLRVRTLETVLGQTALAPLRIATMIVGASATTAFVLSVLGLFGALSDAARDRRRELAIRLALGAQRRHVIFQVFREGGKLAGAGILAGTFGSLVLSRLLTRVTLAREVPALWIWLIAPAVLAGAVAIASALPSRRASMVDPVTILREEN